MNVAKGAFIAIENFKCIQEYHIIMYDLFFSFDGYIIICIRLHCCFKVNKNKSLFVNVNFLFGRLV